MLIAHLPAAYLVGKLLAELNTRSGPGTGTQAQHEKSALFYGALLGGVFPDLDMLWFYFVDQGRVHHHDYITHWPLPYVIMLAFVLVTGKWLGRFWKNALLGFCVSALVHLLLDIWAGPVKILAPFSGAYFELNRVPATQLHWILSFIFHWTFLAEITILLAAGFVFFRNRKT